MAKPGGSITRSWGKLGGDHPMHKFSGSGDQQPGQSAQEGHGGRRDGDPPTGSKHGFYASGAKNQDYAGTQEAGTSGPTKTGGDDKFACGGKGHMFGNRGSLRAEPGKSSP